MDDQPSTTDPSPDAAEVSRSMANIAASGQRLVVDFLTHQAASGMP